MDIGVTMHRGGRWGLAPEGQLLLQTLLSQLVLMDLVGQLFILLERVKYRNYEKHSKDNPELKTLAYQFK